MDNSLDGVFLSLFSGLNLIKNESNVLFRIILKKNQIRYEVNQIFDHNLDSALLDK